MLKTIIKSVAVTAGIAVTLTSGAFAQDTLYAKVPFRVNVNATITAVQGEDTVSKAVAGRTTGADTLKIPLEIAITTAVRDAGKAQGRLNAPTITGTRGNITLRLPAQSYNNAEIALHSVNGKRILRGKADAKDAVSGISRRNIAAGVYLLSVKGNNGTFTTRLTHSGGKMNINVAFGTENALRSPARQLGKKAEIEEGDWEITVSATVAGGYKDSVYTLNLAIGDEYPLQNITLIIPPRVYETFTDERDGTIYKKVEIGEQTWMAENLNYLEDEEGNVLGVCYNNSPDSCSKYGRLYNWSTAMGIDAIYNVGTWGGSDVKRQGVCPAGWHLPSDAEWDVLMTAVGGAPTAGTKLKSTSGWSTNGNGTDDFAFSALPGGVGPSAGGFITAGTIGNWFSSTEIDYLYAWGTSMGSYENVRRATADKRLLVSVRCVQD